MVLESKPQPLLLEGDIVEILQREGRGAVRMRVDSCVFLDLAANGLQDLHLGDRLVVDGSLIVERVASTLRTRME